MTTPTNSGTNAGGQGNPGAGNNAGVTPTPGQVFPRGNSGGGGQGGQQQQGGQQGGQQSDAGDGNLTPEEALGQLLGDNTGQQQGGQQQQGGRTQAPDLSQLPDDVRQYIEGLSGRGNELQRRARELEKERNKGNAAVRKLQEIEDAQKSEADKALAAQRRAEAAAAESEAKVHRLLAAANHDISPDMIDFLGSGTEAEINDRAETLQAAIKAEAARLVQSMIGEGTLPAGNGAQGQRFGSRRPVESLRAGGAPSSDNGGQTADQAFRGLLANVRR